MACQTRNDVIAELESDGPTDLAGWDLTGADLTELDLAGAQLQDANLTGANLSRADLRLGYLYRTNLTGANLTDTNLTWANLPNANLTGANLTNANLTSTSFYTADLTNTNLRGTHLEPSTCTPGQLLHTRGLTRRNLRTYGPHSPNWPPASPGDAPTWELVLDLLDDWDGTLQEAIDAATALRDA